MTEDVLKFVSEEISREADSYAKRECPDPDLRYFYWQAYVSGANRALEKAMDALSKASIWNGMGYNVNYNDLNRRLCKLHNYPQEFYESVPIKKEQIKEE